MLLVVLAVACVFIVVTIINSSEDYSDNIDYGNSIGNSNSFLTGKVVSTPIIPTDCSDASIRAVWDSVFKESSSGIIIFTNTSQVGKCNAFLAYKINGERAYILQGEDVSFVLFVPINVTAIIAAEGNFTQDYLDILGSTTTAIDNLFIDGSTDTFIPANYLKSREISLSQAGSEFNNFFKATPASWKINATSSSTSYMFLDDETLDSGSRGIIGVVLANYTLNVFAFSEIITIVPSCTPSWKQYNTTCLSSESKVTYYIDSNNCGTDSGRPANISVGCDANSNGIIGNVSSFATSRISLSVYINASSASNSKNYTGGIQRVEFKEGSVSRIWFNHNFSVPLDMNAIYIEKQGASSKFGYLIVNGINDSKTITIDRLNGSNEICLKNNHVTSISSLSGDCFEDDEELIYCPGEYTFFSCDVSSSKITVSGLTNSAVRESVGDSYYLTRACTPSWNCSFWGSCINNTQTKICLDLNSCNSSYGKPPGNQACVSCNPSWNCSVWLPEECTKEENRTRTCNDINNCGVNSEKPAEKKSCEYESNLTWIFVVIIVFVCLALIIVLIAIIISIKKQQPSPEATVNYNSPRPFNPKEYNVPPFP